MDFSKIPDHVFLQILRHLPLHERIRVGEVDTHFRRMSEIAISQTKSLDLNDEKFKRTECVGIDRVLKGWAREKLSDQEILRRGWQCFDALYAFLRRI